VDLPSTMALRGIGHRGMRGDRLYRTANSTVVDWLETENVTYFDHNDGIEPEHFASNPLLAQMFDVLATSVDRAGKEYVAAIQGKVMPIYGVQFHPEKIRYVDNRDLPLKPGTATHIPKSPQAIDGADRLAWFFASEARKNEHQSIGFQVGRAPKPALCEEPMLCSCEDLQSKGYAELRYCKKHAPKPAIDYCIIQGPCKTSAEVVRLNVTAGKYLAAVYV